jgi:hypothetical protein
MVGVPDKCTIFEVCTGVLVSNTSDAVGVSLDTAARSAELVNIPIFGCMAVGVPDKCTIFEVCVLDKYTIVEVGTGILVSNTTVAVGVMLDTAARVAELVNIPIFNCVAGVLDKSTIVEVITGVLVANTTDAVGVRLDTAAGAAELVDIPIFGCMVGVPYRSTCLQYL